MPETYEYEERDNNESTSFIAGVLTVIVLVAAVIVGMMFFNKYRLDSINYNSPGFQDPYDFDGGFGDEGFRDFEDNRNGFREEFREQRNLETFRRF